MTVRYMVGDVFDRLAEIPDGSIDLIVTSPPFLALRSYLPPDHPDKGKEIGSEATPAAFLDVMLALSAEWARVLAPHGSLCVELGDTYSGSGGAGGDYGPGGLREGQERFDGSASKAYGTGAAPRPARTRTRSPEKAAPRGVNGKARPKGDKGGGHHLGGSGWPLAKSMTGIPTLYTWSLAYGRNLLTGQTHRAGQWRIRNLICWARPNPPVGALGDKFRPATSYITVACKSPKRWFDLDAVRGDPADVLDQRVRTTNGLKNREGDGAEVMTANYTQRVPSHPNGAPPLDWHADDHPEDGDWLWRLPTQPYKGSHYATFPLELPRRLILAMCPQRVCVECGKPSERIAETVNAIRDDPAERHDELTRAANATSVNTWKAATGATCADRATLGWSECGHDNWRTGIVLDPFAGSGTTLEAAQAVGRDAIGIDLDARNADLARSRVGMFLEVAS